jgi:hypothetical protein
LFLIQFTLSGLFILRLVHFLVSQVRRQLRQQEALAAKAGTAANPELSPMGSALQVG